MRNWDATITIKSREKEKEGEGTCGEIKESIIRWSDWICFEKIERKVFFYYFDFDFCVRNEMKWKEEARER